MKVILGHYERRLGELAGEALTQPIALQLIFDIQHAASLLVGRNNSVRIFCCIFIIIESTLGEESAVFVTGMHQSSVEIARAAGGINRSF